MPYPAGAPRGAGHSGNRRGGASDDGPGGTLNGAPPRYGGRGVARPGGLSLTEPRTPALVSQRFATLSVCRETHGRAARTQKCPRAKRRPPAPPRRNGCTAPAGCAVSLGISLLQLRLCPWRSQSAGRTGDLAERHGEGDGSRRLACAVRGVLARPLSGISHPSCHPIAVLSSGESSAAINVRSPIALWRRNWGPFVQGVLLSGMLCPRVHHLLRANRSTSSEQMAGLSRRKMTFSPHLAATVTVGSPPYRVDALPQHVIGVT
jgi:hypothetical protein